MRNEENVRHRREKIKQVKCEEKRDRIESEEEKGVSGIETAC